MRRGLLATSFLCSFLLSACSGPKRAATDERPDTPTYLDVATAYNERAARLERVWARAVVEARYVDKDGRRRSEQGEGHFQMIAPDRLALSLGKLGETVLFLGCDERRFWLFERVDGMRAAVGLHQNIGRACANDLGLPVHPHDVIDIIGAAPLSTDADAGAVRVERGALIVETRARSGHLRMTLDAATFEPSRIELRAAPGDDAPFVVATLTNYERLAVREGAFGPRIPTRAVIRHDESDSELRLHLYDPSDGVVRGRIAPDVFDFEYLVDALGAREVVVLDTNCPDAAAAHAPR